MYRSIRLKTKDSTGIGIRIFRPETDSQRLIVIGPTPHVSQDHYFHFACFLRDHDFTVITYDFRGVGESAAGKLKNFHANLEHWSLQDTDTVLRHAKNEYPKHELIFLGHGLSGEMIGLAPASQFIKRLVLINASLSATRSRRWKDQYRIEFQKTMTKLSCWLFGYFPGKMFGALNNLPKDVMFQWIHWCNNRNGLFDDFSDHNYRKIDAPLLAMTFTDDWRSQEASVKALLNHFTSAGIQWYHIRPRMIGKRWVRHSGFFKKNDQNVLWSFLLNWLNDQAGEQREFHKFLRFGFRMSKSKF